MRKGLIALLLLPLSLCACGGSGASPSPPSGGARILVVSAGEQVQAVPRGEIQARAFNSALQLALANGTDLGYPWIDPSNGELVVSTVTEKGRQLVEQAGLNVPFTVRTVAHGTTELVGIQDEATQLVTKGVTGAELIYRTLPDHRDNRTLLVIKASNPGLLEALASRFPDGTVAVEITPGP